MNARLLIALALFAVGCASLEANTSGRGLLDPGNLSLREVYEAALQAAHNANFIVETTDSDAGHLYATRTSNPLLSDAKKIALSVQVRESADGFVVDILSSLPGQVVSWGETRRAVEDYGRALRKLLPDLILTIDGKRY